MRTLATILLLCCCCFAQDESRTPSTQQSATCTSTSFTGNVKRGQPFVQLIGDGLSYRLAPFRQSSQSADSTDFSGWTIEVAYLRQKGDMEREFSWVMTPPYRQWNARQLNTSYGKSIEEVLNADHTVYFPLHVLEYAEADKLVTRILWRSSADELKEAAQQLPHIPVGSARLTLLGQQLGGEKAAPISIELISFKVELTVPSTLKLAPDLARRAKAAACPVSPLVPMLNEMQQ